MRWNDTRTSGVTPYVRWRHDPELGIDGKKLPRSTIQVSLSPVAVENSLFTGWIVKVEDMTEVMRKVVELVEDGRLEEAKALLPNERAYDFLGDTR